MTDNEIKKALECCTNKDRKYCTNCPLKNEFVCVNQLASEALDLINRQKAEIEELTYKLECLLCHATGSKLSKSTYSLKTMESAVNDEVQECYEEARAEAIKEFAEIIKDRYPNKYVVWGGGAYGITFENFIDNLVKEMVGDAE